jgi:hypothetical protein
LFELIPSLFAPPSKNIPCRFYLFQFNPIYDKGQAFIVGKKSKVSYSYGIKGNSNSTEDISGGIV